MDLPERIAAVRAGNGEPAAMVGEFRRTAVLPLTGGRFMTGHGGGVRWIYAFTGERQLARFARARGAASGEAWEYAAVLGARVLDVLVPELPGPAGVAVDVADANGSMLLPPVRGIVPDEAAERAEDTAETAATVVAGDAGVPAGADTAVPRQRPRGRAAR
ncbi:hypothetical protein LIX60_20560 [Streptomyces sp. S07_1.15]|uniref:hypothetical protein n=1 Tax=Streptomyces sp. S07_1.15 TaxID=2873925 RepID=UPI001D1393EE|nr:hypothetical protein [Streptomyces sp. S07_1.15]MCC3653807.1 hypothetical protein [Streptomyces sp. S07_1.15]